MLGDPALLRRARCPSVVSLALMVTVLMPLPAADFDPTEVAVSWQVLAAAGHDVVFATPSGQRGQADDLMVTGRGLDPWGFVPGLRRLTVVGRVLRADADARRVVRRIAERRGLRGAAALGRGPAERLRRVGAARRAPGAAGCVRLEGPEVQQMAVDAFRAEKPVGAICHGVLVAARAVDPVTERSVLYGRRTTALTWALEDKAWGIARLHAVLGPRLLPDLHGGTGAALGVPVGAAGGHAGIGRSRRLCRRGEGLAGPATEGQRAGAEHADRRAPRLRRTRRFLRVGSLARRRPHLRSNLRSSPGREGLTVSCRRARGRTTPAASASRNRDLPPHANGPPTRPGSAPPRLAGVSRRTARGRSRSTRQREEVGQLRPRAVVGALEDDDGRRSRTDRRPIARHRPPSHRAANGRTPPD